MLERLTYNFRYSGHPLRGVIGGLLVENKLGQAMEVNKSFLTPSALIEGDLTDVDHDRADASSFNRCTEVCEMNGSTRGC